MPNLVNANSMNERENQLVLSQILFNLENNPKAESFKTDIEKARDDIERAPDMHASYRIINRLLAELEEKRKARYIVKLLKKQGLYSMLYTLPKFDGIPLYSSDSLHQSYRNGMIGVGLSLLITGGFVAATLLGAPAWVIAITTGLFVGAVAYLGGILYGVVNDLFATNSCSPYFLLGHQSQQYSLLKTNNKIALAHYWGVAASFGFVVLAAVVFTIAAVITAFAAPAMASFLLPGLIIAMPLIAIGAHIYAKIKEKTYTKDIAKRNDDAYSVSA